MDIDVDWAVVGNLAQAVAAFAAVAAAIAAFLTVRLARDELVRMSKSSEAGEAIALSRRWSDPEMAAAVLSVRTWFHPPSGAPPDAARIGKMRQEGQSAINDAKRVLNHLTVVASSVRSGATDANMVYSLYGNILVSYRSMLRLFIEDERAHGRYPQTGWRLWDDLEFVATRWEPLVHGTTPHAQLVAEDAPGVALGLPRRHV